MSRILDCAQGPALHPRSRMNDVPPPGVVRPTATLRAMTAADVPTAMELKTMAGWNQTARDWLGYLAFAPGGCFVAEVAGRAVGTATSIRYGDRFGWIGMVLVHPEVRRLGLGSRLLRQTIDYLQASGTGCVKLDATAMGRAVYLPMGFRDEFGLSRFEGVASVGDFAPSASVQPITSADLPDIIAFDAPAFGAERGTVLHSLSERKPEWCFVQRDAGKVSGYLIAREGHSAAQLGPWVARDGPAAEQLLQAFLAAAPGQRIFVDVPHPNPIGCALVRKYGFTVQRDFARMFLGANLFPGSPTHVFGSSGAEKG